MWLGRQWHWLPTTIKGLSRSAFPPWLWSSSNCRRQDRALFPYPFSSEGTFSHIANLLLPKKVWAEKKVVLFSWDVEDVKIYDGACVVFSLFAWSHGWLEKVFFALFCRVENVKFSSLFSLLPSLDSFSLSWALLLFLLLFFGQLCKVHVSLSSFFSTIIFLCVFFLLPVLIMSAPFSARLKSQLVSVKSSWSFEGSWCPRKSSEERPPRVVLPFLLCLTPERDTFFSHPRIWIWKPRTFRSLMRSELENERKGKRHVHHPFLVSLRDHLPSCDRRIRRETHVSFPCGFPFLILFFPFPSSVVPIGFQRRIGKKGELGEDSTLFFSFL